MQLNLLKALGLYFGNEEQLSPIFKHLLTLNQNKCFQHNSSFRKDRNLTACKFCKFKRI